MEIYKLTGETIDLVSEKITELYKSLGVGKKETLRARFLLEEALLKYQSHFGEEIDVYFRSYRIFSQTRFAIRLRAPSFDPFTLEENPMSFMIQSILSGFENGMPTWKYRNLENEIVFTVNKKKRLGNLTKLVISLGAALVLGLLARLLIPQDGLSMFVSDYIEPISNAYAGLFCVMAVLLTMFAVVLSIVHIGDMTAVGALGGMMMRRYYKMSVLFALVFTLCIIPFFKISGLGAISVAAKSIYDILVGFIPTNIVSPFLNFNSIHIMIVGAMFGFSLLTMGQKGETVVKLFDECNLVAVYTNNFLNRFISIYVALKVFTIVTTSQLSGLSSAGKMVAAIVIAEIIIFAFYALYASTKCKMPVAVLTKKLMPPFLICLSSANFGAAYSAMFDALLSTGADGDKLGMSLSIGSVVFQPASTVMFILSSLFMAAEYNVEISVMWLLIAFLLSIVLVASMPNIPGAAISVFTLLFAQLGLPAEALSLMIALTAVLQFLTVAVDTWCLMCESAYTCRTEETAAV